MRQAAAQAADAIRDAILAGRIPAGARIAELDLARQLSVSRTPIREALSRLARAQALWGRVDRSFS